MLTVVPRLDGGVTEPRSCAILAWDRAASIDLTSQRPFSWSNDCLWSALGKTRPAVVYWPHLHDQGSYEREHQLLMSV